MKNLLAVLAIPLTVLTLTGCVSNAPLEPTREVTLHPYRGDVSFLLEDPSIDRNIVRQVYAQERDEELLLAMQVSEPQSGVMSFPNNEPKPGSMKPEHLALLPGDPAFIELSTGVYPFLLKSSIKAEATLSGLFVVYNLGADAQFVTLGADPEGDRILEAGLISEAKEEGKLIRFTMSMDGKPILTYFIGNRKEPDLEPRANTTVELDFQKTPQITSLKIGDQSYTNKVATLPIYKLVRNDVIKQDVPVAREHTVRFSAGGKNYRGVIRLKKDSMETRMTRMACTVPSELLENADMGALSRFAIRTQGENVARGDLLLEISFGRDRSR